MLMMITLRLVSHCLRAVQMKLAVQAMLLEASRIRTIHMAPVRFDLLCLAHRFI